MEINNRARLKKKNLNRKMWKGLQYMMDEEEIVVSHLFLT